MKKTHIFLLVVIAVAVAMIVSTAGDASQYVTFKEAKALADKGSTTSIHVVGGLKKDAQGNILGLQYEPSIDPNRFVFTLVDDNQEEHQVIYNQPKPNDFERSEKVVVVGKFKNNKFHAEKILMKCPSKYNETEFKEAKIN